MEISAMGFGKPILKGQNKRLGVRVLRPSEYVALRQGAEFFDPDNGTNLDALLVTAMRYVEAQRLQKHPEWFDGRFVYLPSEGQLKEMSKQKERWIRLSQKGVGVMTSFWSSRPLSSWWAWSDNLKRWAMKVRLDPIGLSPKTTRKTYESWLVSTYPERGMEVAMRQGHSTGTAWKYYLNLPFLPEDKEAMKPFVDGMF